MKEYIEFFCDCGKLLKVPKDRAGQTGKCSKCSKAVTIPLASSYDKDSQAKKTSSPIKETESKKAPIVKQASPVKKEAKKSDSNAQKEKKGSKTLLWILIFFLLGVFVGIAIGPEYGNLLPNKETLLKKLFWWQEKIPEPIPQEQKENRSAFNEPKKDTQEIYNKEKPRIEIAIKNIEAYLSDLDKETNVLREKKNILETQYSITTSEEVDKLFKESSKMKSGLEERVNYAKNALQLSRWELLPQAYEYLKDYEDVKSDTSPLIKNLQKAYQKIESDLGKYQSHIAAKPLKESSPYLGVWYDSLKGLMIQWKEIRQSTQNPTAKFAVLQAIQSIMNKFATYPGDIHETSETLLNIMKKKDIQRWIQFRKDNSSSESQRKQGLSIEKFLHRDKKFDLELLEELDSLQRELLAFQNKEKQEESAKNILTVLRTIERKYNEAYRDFNSGVMHFENYE